MDEIIKELNDSYLSDDVLTRQINLAYKEWRTKNTVTVYQLLFNTLIAMDKVNPLPYDNMKRILDGLRNFSITWIPNYYAEHGRRYMELARQNVNNYTKQQQAKTNDSYIEMRNDLHRLVWSHPGLIPMTPMHVHDPNMYSAFGNNLINNLGGIFR